MEDGSAKMRKEDSDEQEAKRGQRSRNLWGLQGGAAVQHAHQKGSASLRGKPVAPPSTPASSALL